MDLKEHIVGEVEGYPVIYIEEKDTIFCKNTAVKLSLIHISEPTRLLSASRMPSSA